MNNLENAAYRVEQGWCRGKMKNGDQHCALGAIAVELGIDHKLGLEHSYTALKATPEVAALYAEIVESGWITGPVHPVSRPHQFLAKSAHARGSIVDVVFYFNDAQDTAEPVIEMMKRASKRLD